MSGKKERRHPSWGGVIWIGDNVVDMGDEIRRKIEEARNFSPEPFEEGESIEEWKKRNSKKKSEMEKEIWDMIYAKRIKRMLRT